MDLARAYLEISRLPHLSRLQSELRKKYGTDDVANEGYLELLPHALSSTAFSLLSVFRAEHAAMSSVRQRADHSAGICVYQLEVLERFK